MFKTKFKIDRTEYTEMSKNDNITEVSIHTNNNILQEINIWP